MAAAKSPKEQLNDRLAERCRQLRERRSLSQMDMVRKFGWSLSHYQKIERRGGLGLDARLSTLKRLADDFGVTLSELLHDL